MEANLHWKYFLTIDQDLSHISRYIEFSKDNFGVYSIELVRLFLSVCAEIDVVMKILCETHCKDQYDKEIKTKRNPNMDVYRLIVTNYFKYFSSVCINLSHGHKIGGDMCTHIGRIYNRNVKES